MLKAALTSTWIAYWLNGIIRVAWGEVIVLIAQCFAILIVIVVQMAVQTGQWYCDTHLHPIILLFEYVQSGFPPQQQKKKKRTLWSHHCWLLGLYWPGHGHDFLMMYTRCTSSTSITYHYFSEVVMVKFYQAMRVNSCSWGVCCHVCCLTQTKFKFKVHSSSTDSLSLGAINNCRTSCHAEWPGYLLSSLVSSTMMVTILSTTTWSNCWDQLESAAMCISDTFWITLFLFLLLMVSCGALGCSWERATDNWGLNRHHATCHLFKKSSTLASQKDKTRQKRLFLQGWFCPIH
jgi:hypothetical protein